MRQLMGRWKATPFGETMELEFGLSWRTRRFNGRPAVELGGRGADHGGRVSRGGRTGAGQRNPDGSETQRVYRTARLRARLRASWGWAAFTASAWSPRSPSPCSRRTPTSPESGAAIVLLARLLFLLLTYVVACFWIYNAACNARAFGARGLQISPGWAVGLYFDPGHVLFKPFQAWRRSGRRASRRRLAGAEDPGAAALLVGRLAADRHRRRVTGSTMRWRARRRAT